MNISFSKLTWSGRTLDHNNIRYFDYSASGFSFYMKGKRAVATILSDANKFEPDYRGVLGVYVSKYDAAKKNAPCEKNPADEKFFKIRLDENENEIVLFESEKAETVQIRVIRLSEAVYGYSGLKLLEVDGKIIKNQNKINQCVEKSDTSKSADKISKLKFEIIGDSITCGYGIEGVYEKDIFTTSQERPDMAYAYLTMKNLNADFHLVSRSGIGLISCYADPETYQVPNLTEPLMSQLWPYTDRFLSTRLNLEPQVWDPANFPPDVVILHLGTNDQSWVRNLEDRRQSFINLYEQMLESIHRRSPDAKIVCCLGVMGQDLCGAVEEARKNFAKTFPAVPTMFVKFPLQDEAKDGVGTDWHPSAKTHQKMAALLTEKLREFL